MTDTTGTERWRANRTTFQRVYDTLVGTRSFETAAEIATRAECSETGARRALEQLVEMGIAERRDGRPARYARNDAYLTWKRIESLAREHRPDALRARVDALIEEDDAFQERFGVPDPDAVTNADFATGNGDGNADHEALHEHWEALGEWRTVRRDIRVLRRAVRRAETRLEDGARA